MIKIVKSEPAFNIKIDDLIPILVASWNGAVEVFLSIHDSKIFGIILYEPIAVQYWFIVAGSGFLLRGKNETSWIVLIKVQAADGLEIIDF